MRCIVPKAILKFNLPEEQDEYKITLNASKYYCALWDFQQELRKIWKYEEGLTEKEQEMVERIKELFWTTLQDNEVSGEF